MIDMQDQDKKIANSVLYTDDKEYNLFIDDQRDLNQTYTMTLDKDYIKLKWYIVRSYIEFCSFVENSYLKYKSKPRLISFDHDLADEHYLKRDEPIPYNTFIEKTGFDCAKWIIKFCHENKIELPLYKTHTMNFVGEKILLMNLINILNDLITNKLID